MQTQQLPPAENDVAVLLLFFTRAEVLQRTFDAIRLARPARLFLYQDGPRNETEAAKTEAARRIVADEQIDWQCDIHRNYHVTNQGLWTSTYDSQRWAFSLYDKCIILEEDSTPAPSFIRFCSELLVRYEHDLRIGMIAGFNHEEQTASPYDYLFTTMMPIWGWASWRRVVDGWDSTYSVVDDEFNMRQLCQWSMAYGQRSMVKMMRKHKKQGKPVYETVLWSYLALHSCLTIVPTRNMIHNSAVSDDSVHYKAGLKTLPRRIQKLLTMPAHDMTFPLRHPPLIIEDVEYKQRVFRIMAWEHPWIKISRSVEELYRNLRYGNIRNIWQSVVRRVKILTGRYDYL
jgi:hypothetical protein